MFDTDVFVLGGGPAGLAAAIAARRAGFQVVLADAEYPPVEKACGEGLLPDSLAAAARLGIVIPPELGFAFRGISFRGTHSAAADFPGGAGLGVRRPELQRLLIKRAEETGVHFLWGQPVSGINRNTVRLGNGQRLDARWIIGADGAQSSVRRWAQLQLSRRDSRRFSYRRHYRIAPWSEYMEVHWGHHAQFYVTPVGQNEVCLVLMTPDSHRRIDAMLPHFPHLQSRLEGCETSTPERGALAATRRLKRVTRGHVGLIGDASGTIDPISGEGICLAFKQALALADALSAGDLELYEQAHVRLSRRPRFMSDFMLLMDRSNFLQWRTLSAFEARPHLLADLLALHVGKLQPLRFLTTAAALGWQVVNA